MSGDPRSYEDFRIRWFENDVLNVAQNCTTEVESALASHVAVAVQLGPFAAPDVVQWAPGLPRTRRGKIIRRVLREIAAIQLDRLADISTLDDSSVVSQLVQGRRV